MRCIDFAAEHGFNGVLLLFGAVTDEEERELALPPSFLEMGNSYTAQVYREGEDAHWTTNLNALVIGGSELSAARRCLSHLHPLAASRPGSWSATEARDYSCLKASIGSSCEARRAG